VAKKVSMPMVHSAETITSLGPRLTLSQNGLKHTFASPMSPRSSTGASKTIYEPIACLAQTMPLSCVKISTIFKRASI
jgi:hypothetical protein